MGRYRITEWIGIVGILVTYPSASFARITIGSAKLSFPIVSCSSPSGGTSDLLIDLTGTMDRRSSYTLLLFSPRYEPRNSPGRGDVIQIGSIILPRTEHSRPRHHVMTRIAPGRYELVLLDSEAVGPPGRRSDGLVSRSAVQISSPPPTVRIPQRIAAGVPFSIEVSNAIPVGDQNAKMTAYVLSTSSAGASSSAPLRRSKPFAPCQDLSFRQSGYPAGRYELVIRFGRTGDQSERTMHSVSFVIGNTSPPNQTLQNVLISPSGPPLATAMGQPKGTIVVNAANGNRFELVSKSNGSAEGDPALAQFQCVELISRYAAGFGFSPNALGDGHRVAMSFAQRSNGQFNFVGNGTSGIPPKVGAVVSISATDSQGAAFAGGYGHVGIVQRVESIGNGSFRVTLFDQNWPTPSGQWKTLIFTAKEGKWSGVLTNTRRSGGVQTVSVVGWSNPS